MRTLLAAGMGGGKETNGSAWGELKIQRAMILSNLNNACASLFSMNGRVGEHDHRLDMTNSCLDELQ